MFDDAARAIARALEGSGQDASAALRELAKRDPDGALAEDERVGGALAMAAHHHAVAGPALGPWRRALHAQVARNFLLDDAATLVADTLAAAGVRWVPIKGFDLATRVYAQREERRTSDLDLLVPEEAWLIARVALRAAGFRDLSDDPFGEDYLRREGYAWQAWSPRGVLVELHFRLWGSAPSSLAPALLAAAQPDPSLGATGCRARLEDAFLLAAFHYWLDTPPRPLGPLRDLCRLLAADPKLPAKVLAAARCHQLELPTALATALTAELFELPAAAALVSELRASLRAAERRLPINRHLPLRRLAVARWLAGRPSRHGLRLFWRAVWPHAAVVAAATPVTWPWLLRRLWYQCRRPGPPPSGRTLPPKTPI